MCQAASDNLNIDLAKRIELLQDVATRIRILSVKATDAAKSGHPTSCASIAEIMAVLFLDEMVYDPFNFLYHQNDRFILSKGHAAPALYAAMCEAGFYKESDLLTLRKIDSDLEGHPTPRLPFVDVATGSLGQGLSVAAGMAYCGKYIDKMNYRVYCIIGDGESAEGSIWEALAFSSHYRLDNLVAIFDINRLGQSEATSLNHKMDVYQQRISAFGWHTVVVDGHSVEELRLAFEAARNCPEKPTAILAKTFKGHDFSGIADLDNWHGKPLGSQSEKVLANLQAKIKEPDMKLSTTSPENMTEKDSHLIGHMLMPSPPSFTKGENVATRAAYGTALAKLGKANPRVIGLDGDTKNSTFSIKLKEVNENQFVECFIAEQNMVGVGIGLACRERTVTFLNAFAAFFTRAFDQIRMAAISQSNCNFVGSHAGVSIGEDGPSQMALEDLAMFRSIPNATVFYPSDAVSCERAVELAANTRGICFIRTGRPANPVIYENEEVFHIGQAK
ncbi:hypothetical protein Ciccas_008133, partial [Cichlidogyrus casuarinus]